VQQTHVASFFSSALYSTVEVLTSVKTWD